MPTCGFSLPKRGKLFAEASHRVEVREGAPTDAGHVGGGQVGASGVAIGADSAIATAYISEFAPKDRRGSLALLQQWMITVGILVAYLIALLIFAVWPASAASSGWRLVLGLGASASCPSYAAMLWSLTSWTSAWVRQSAVRFL